MTATGYTIHVGPVTAVTQYTGVAQRTFRDQYRQRRGRDHGRPDLRLVTSEAGGKATSRWSSTHAAGGRRNDQPPSSDASEGTSSGQLAHSANWNIPQRSP